MRDDDVKPCESTATFAEMVAEFPKTIGHAAKRTGNTPVRSAGRSRPTEPQPFHLHTEELARLRNTKPIKSTDEMEEEMIKNYKPFKVSSTAVLHF